MLILLNNAMPYIGFVLCLLVWRLERFNTKPFAIQVTFIVWIVTMIMLYLADHNPDFTPVFGSVMGRYLILLSVICVACYVYIATQEMRRLNDLVESKDQEIERLKEINYVPLTDKGE